MRRKLCNIIIATIVTVGLALAFTGLVYAGDSVIISNASFEVDDFNSIDWPGYCSLTGWTFNSTEGGPGVSTKGDWFWDNGMADQNQTAFIQGLGILSQTLNGLQVGKQYWLQYFYNTHATDCAARGLPYTTPMVTMVTSFDGANLSSIQVNPVEGMGSYSQQFYCATIPFTPASSTGSIGIGVSSVAYEGNSLQLDCVSVIQRDANEVVIKNPSFEGSGINNWLIVGQGNLLGWDSHWTSAGICHNGEAFADNGVPDGQCVGFMQGQNSKLSQTITGLQAGKLYMLSYYYNIRAGTVYGGMKVTLGSTVVQDSPDLTAVGGTNPYYRNAYFFVSDGTDQTLTFMQTKAGDCTCLVDNVSITRVDYDITAANTANLQSVSDGQVVRLTSPQVVTAVFSDGTYYVEDINRIAGIKVVGSGVQLGDRVDLVAKLCTDSTTGEKYLQMQAYSRASGQPLEPLAMTNKSLGGAHTGYQPGITDASGLNNIGLLVKTTGKITSCVTENEKSDLTITDGSGVTVHVLDLPNGYSEDDHVAVTGISSMYKETDGTLTRTILPRGSDDVIVLDNVPAVCQTGWQIYAPPSSGQGYRYGPSIIINNDNSIDMWLSSPAGGNEWDMVNYRHSTDGGHTWTTDVVALRPTPGSRDALACCDPGVIKFGGYYYIGYTSTQVLAGTDNHLYIARGTSPTGPFQKWSGSGWGNNPQPIVSYTGAYTNFGVGEPSMVLHDGKLYIYYTYRETNCWYTHLAISDDPTAADWPAHLRHIDKVINHPMTPETDSVDVKYVDSLDRFIAMAVTNRFNPGAAIMLWESRDGINWSQAPFSGVALEVGAHNVGISGTETGHFDTSKNNFIAYAYWPSGYYVNHWPSYMNPFYLDISE